jgi:hypothetical protein
MQALMGKNEKIFVDFLCFPLVFRHEKVHLIAVHFFIDAKGSSCFSPYWLIIDIFSHV